MEGYLIEFFLKIPDHPHGRPHFSYLLENEGDHQFPRDPIYHSHPIPKGPYLPLSPNYLLFSDPHPNIGYYFNLSSVPEDWLLNKHP